MRRDMVRRMLWFTAAAALLLLAATTLAQPAGGAGAGRGHGGGLSADKLFERFDANQDGKLEKDELPARLADKLTKADADADGAITKDELEKARQRLGGGAGGPKGVDELFKAFDKNGDGVLTQDEVPEKLAMRIAAADANGDGKITKEELEQARAAHEGAGGGKPIDKIFERLDVNKDGKLTKEELPERLADKLMKADADGDGAVTKEELEQARQKMAGQFVDKLFERFDANRDGKLTKEELPERIADRIMKADADGDGAVTKAELQAAREKLGPRPGATVLFRHFDRDANGKLVASEVPAFAQERLLRADANGDGGVTPEEIRDAIRARFA